MRLQGESGVAAWLVPVTVDGTVMAGPVRGAGLRGRQCVSGGVLGGQPLDGFAGDHLVEVAELAHELADVLPLGKDHFLSAGQLAFGVEGSLPPGRFDPVVFLARALRRS
ncbi:hypothetical protein [Streptomyces sp. NBC_01615]|uniref:hypothetical protein n=1 Tax=Streptomyces sp. NBC_01615 TaxID=2975898 RepID=UPI0038669F8B